MFFKNNGLVVVVLLSFALFIGCGKSNVSSTSSNGSETAEKIEINLGHPFPKTDYRARGYQYWADLVEERTGGEITFKLHLVSITESFDALSTGVIDMYVLTSSYVTGDIPQVGFFDVMGAYDPNQWIKLHEAIFPLVDSIFSKHNMKYLFGVYEGQVAVISNKPLLTPDDFKGQKIRTSGEQLVKAIQLFGGSPVDIPLGEVPQAVNSGVVDGAFIGWPNIQSLKLYESLAHTTIFTTSSGVWEFGSINLDVWNKLSQEQQNIMMEAGKEAMVKMEEFAAENYQNLLNGVASNNANLYELKGAEEQTFKDLVQPIFNNLYENADEQGKELYDIIKQYQ